MKLVVVTASTNPHRAADCLASWGMREDVPIIVVVNGNMESVLPLASIDELTILGHQQYLGTVPAFRRGVDFALDHTDADIIACLHDDVEILEPNWVERVTRHFERHPACGLAGFGGAIGLGSDDLYTTPYDAMHLARIGFRSNLVDAEVHGQRSLLAERVACLDGFSQIGRREFWLGEPEPSEPFPMPAARPLAYLEDHGLVHHFYDGALGAYAARLRWESWYLPIRCRHLGGQTAVGDKGYQEWAKSQIPEGDQGFWQISHKRGYELFNDVLPLRV